MANATIATVAHPKITQRTWPYTITHFFGIALQQHYQYN